MLADRQFFHSRNVLKKVSILKYYPNAVRVNGLKQQNNDALMIKAIRLPLAESLVAVVFLNTDKGQKRYGNFTSDLIRRAEYVFHEEIPKVVYKSFQETRGEGDAKIATICSKYMFNKLSKKRAANKEISLNVMVMYKNSVSFNCVSVRPLIISKDFIEECGENVTLKEGSSILMATPNLYEKCRNEEIHGLLSPQMCADSDYIDYALLNLIESAKVRGEKAPVSAACLCIK